MQFSNGRGDVAEMLVTEFGADPNIQTIGKCYSTLHFIVHNGHAKHTDLLTRMLELGTNPELRNNYGETAEHVAKDYPAFLNILRQWKAKSASQVSRKRKR